MRSDLRAENTWLRGVPSPYTRRAGAARFRAARTDQGGESGPCVTTPLLPLPVPGPAGPW